MSDTTEAAPRLLSIEDILAAAPTKPAQETIPTPFWGGSVTVRGLTHAEMHHARRIATAGYTKPDDEAVLQQEVFILGFVPPDGKRPTAEQYKRLSYRAGRGIVDVVNAILRLSGASEVAAQEIAASFPQEPGTSV